MEARARREPDPPPDPAERARSIALRLLEHAPRSEARLREGLVSRGVEQHLADGAIARLREVGLLDDTALAATIAQSRQKGRGHARKAIARDLRLKGFGAHDVEAAIGNIGPSDEAAAAEAFVRRRWASLAALAPEVRMRRLVAALGRRGYPPGMAFSLVREVERADIWDNRVGEAGLAEEV